jgi:hypothetical protein
LVATNQPIQNAYGLSTPVPGKDGEIGWDIWSNIHYGIVGRHAGFTADELKAGADGADVVFADDHRPNEGDKLAVQIGIDLYEKYGKDVTPEQIQNAVIAHYNEFGNKGRSTAIRNTFRKAGPALRQRAVIAAAARTRARPAHSGMAMAVRFPCRLGTSPT